MTATKIDPISSVPRAVGEANRAESVREIILDRAIELFEKKSFRGTSMNDLAQACGVSKPAIYYYFRNKSQLLETLYENITRDFFGATERLRDSTESPTQKLRWMIEHQTLHNIANKRFLTTFWRERNEFDEDLRKALARRERDFETFVQRLIEDGQACGELAPGNARVRMLGVLGMLGSVHLWAAHAQTPPAHIALELASLILQGLQSPRP